MTNWISSLFKITSLGTTKLGTDNPLRKVLEPTVGMTLINTHQFGIRAICSHK